MEILLKYSVFIIHTTKKTWKWWESQKIHCKNWEELKLWRARNLLLEGKITVFKSLALSQITYLALVKTIPPSIIDQLKKTQKNFIWKRLNPKIKNSTINNNYENGGLNNVNIAAKLILLAFKVFG